MKTFAIKPDSAMRTAKNGYDKTFIFNSIYFHQHLYESIIFKVKAQLKAIIHANSILSKKMAAGYITFVFIGKNETSERTLKANYQVTTT